MREIGHLFFHEDIAQIMLQRLFIEHLKMGVADTAVGVKNVSRIQKAAFPPLPVICA